MNTSHNGLAVGVEYNTPYDLTGSDLYVADPEEMLPNIEEYLARLEEAVDTQRVSRTDIDESVQLEARLACDQYKARLDEMSQEDRRYARGLQGWVLQELKLRQDERGEAFEQGSNESYLETITVLDAVIAELETEKEDPKLIKLAEVWRSETQAELVVHKVEALHQKAYRLAA